MLVKKSQNGSNYIFMHLYELGYLWFHTLRAEHAGRVYSSLHMKIKCAATHLSPNVAAHTREVPLLGVGKET